MSDPISVSPERDMAARFRPAPWQVTAAQALLLYAPPVLGVDRVVVALVLPGKQRGVWTPGQPVEVVNGLWLADTTAGAADVGVFAHYRVRAAVEAVALAQLAGRAGIPAHAIIDRLGRFEVFEGHDPGAGR
jgi:hypothetical protein